MLLVIPEYSHFTDNWNGGEVAYKFIFAGRQFRLLLHPGLYGLPGKLQSSISTHLQRFIAGFRPPNPLAYRRDGFNPYGDYIGHLEMGRTKPLQKYRLWAPQSEGIEPFLQVCGGL
ncbi:MAG: hypothetical protein LBD93_05060 [Treponema sp.]|nr:hypothetical protein [Treponema sp.]